MLVFVLTGACQQAKTKVALSEKAQRHIFEGEINKKGKAVGCHHITAIKSGQSKIVSVVKQPNAKGVYEAVVEVYDKNKGVWIRKDARSTFFPDSWSKQKVIEEIEAAFNSPDRILAGNKWTSVSPSGVKIGGYTDNNGNIATAYPIY